MDQLRDNKTVDFSESEIFEFRKDTEGTRSTVHLNNAGAGLMPDVVTESIIDHLILESEIGGYEASDLRASAIEEFYNQAATLLNCKPTEMAFTSSATDSFSRALSSIPFETGDVILTDADNFVSNQIQYLSLQKHKGVRVVHIKNDPAGGVDLNDLSLQLRRLRPRLLSITHMPTNSGLVQPVMEIGAIYRNYRTQTGYDSWYILDVCQSVGQTKLDVMSLGCDFASMTGRKFLRGPRGTGMLYVSARALASGLEPMFIDMRGAEWIEKDKYRPVLTGKRFEDWEFAYATVLGTAEAIKYCRDVGEDRIWNRVKKLGQYTRNKLAGMNAVKLQDRGKEKSAIVTFHLDRPSPDQLLKGLHLMNINAVASYRAYGLIDFDEKNVPWVIRVSPHYYNTLDEIDLFADTLEKLL